MVVEIAGAPPAGSPSLARRPIADGPRGMRRAPDLADNAVLVAREMLSPTVARLVVRPDAGVGPFVAGQYLALGVRIDDRVVQRPYSTASDPAAADSHEFLVRRVPDGALTPRLWTLPVGARVHLGPPKGTFTLVAGDRKPHLFVATGTGIAPFLGMLRTLARRPEPPRTILLHGAARVEDLVCGDDVADLVAGGLSITYVPTISRPDDPANRGWSGRTGRAEAMLASVLRSAGLGPGGLAPGGLGPARGLGPGGISAYLCGNPGMVAAAEAVLLEHGIPAADIHAERYWTAPSATGESSAAGAIVGASPA
jgi:ferredoxin--NADP+ reductase